MFDPFAQHTSCASQRAILRPAGLERGPGDYDDPEEGLYNSGYLVVRGASESRGGGWVAVYEPETIRAHRPQLG